MAKIPERVRIADYVKAMIVNGLSLFSQGKVRDIFEVPNPVGEINKLLQVASDRISIYDFVLNALVRDKGEILTALTHFWLTTVLKDYPNHLVRSGIRNSSNAAVDLHLLYRAIPVRRTLVVQKLKMPPWEMVFRMHLGGSVWKDYLKDGMVAGYKLPPGLVKWQSMERPLFTPSSKAEDGHDENKTHQEFYSAMGKEGVSTVDMFYIGYLKAYKYAEERGILILDTKFEGLNKFCDEVLTPDSSRFTTVEDFTRAIKEGRDPVSKDKQIVRNWGVTVETPFGITGLNNLDPKNPEHVDFVSQLKVPGEILEETTHVDHWIFDKLVGKSLADYQRENMGII